MAASPKVHDPGGFSTAGGRKSSVIMDRLRSRPLQHPAGLRGEEPSPGRPHPGLTTALAVAEAVEKAAEYAAFAGERGGDRGGGALPGDRLVVVGPGDRVDDVLLGEVLGAVDLRDEADEHAVAHDLSFQSCGAVGVPFGQPAARQ